MPDDAVTPQPAAQDPRAPIQAQLQAQLFAVLVTFPADHSVKLGALISLFAAIARQNPCCTGASADVCAQVAATLYDQAYGVTSDPAADPAADAAPPAGVSPITH